MLNFHFRADYIYRILKTFSVAIPIYYALYLVFDKQGEALAADLFFQMFLVCFFSFTSVGFSFYYLTCYNQVGVSVLQIMRKF